MASAKQIAAAKKNVKKAQAANRAKNKGNPKKKTSNPSNPSNPKKKSTRRKNNGFLAPRTGGPRKGLPGFVNTSSKVIANGTLAIGGLNAPAVILTGHSVTRPVVGYDSGSVNSGLNPPSLASPAPGGPFGSGTGIGTTRVFIDVLGLPWDTVNRNGLRQAAVARGLRIQDPFINGVRQNLSNAIRTPEGRAAAFGPLLVGVIAKGVDRFVTPPLVNAMKATTRGLTDLTRMGTKA